MKIGDIEFTFTDKEMDEAYRWMVQNLSTDSVADLTDLYLKSAYVKQGLSASGCSEQKRAEIAISWFNKGLVLGAEIYRRRLAEKEQADKEKLMRGFKGMTEADFNE